MHQHTLVSMTNLGSLYKNAGELEEAEKLYREALGTKQKTRNKASASPSGETCLPLSLPSTLSEVPCCHLSVFLSRVIGSSHALLDGPVPRARRVNPENLDLQTQTQNPHTSVS